MHLAGTPDLESVEARLILVFLIMLHACFLFLPQKSMLKGALAQQQQALFRHRQRLRRKGRRHHRCVRSQAEGSN